MLYFVAGLEGPIFDSHGHVLPHSILGSVQEFKNEAIARGHSQVGLICDCYFTGCIKLYILSPVLGTFRGSELSSKLPFCEGDLHQNFLMAHTIFVLD